MSGSDAVASEVALSHFAPSPLINYYFQSILAVMVEKKIPVVLLSLPLNEATCRVMDPLLRPAFAAYLRRVIATDPQVSILGPVRQCWPDRLFGDAYHLNGASADQYTTLVARWLRPTKPEAVVATRIVER